MNPNYEFRDFYEISMNPNLCFCPIFKNPNYWILGF